jgi:hypothetical protein
MSQIQEKYGHDLFNKQTTYTKSVLLEIMKRMGKVDMNVSVDEQIASFIEVASQSILDTHMYYRNKKISNGA